MQFNDYQRRAMELAIYPGRGEPLAPYALLGLAGETGEVCEKAKKILRDGDGSPTAEDIGALQKELGDILWYLAAIANDLGLDLNDVARANLLKLNSRRDRGVLHGSGDHR